MEAVEAIKAGTVNAEGKKKAVTFNKQAFDTLVTSLLNDVDYEVETAVADDTQEAGFRIEKSQPVKEFRKSIEQLLIDAGVDKVEAAHQAQTAEIKTINGMHEIVSESIYHYLKAGKKFTFLTKPDFAGEIVTNEVEEGIQSHSNPQDRTAKIEQSVKQHTKLKSKPSVPDWLKTRLK